MWRIILDVHDQCHVKPLDCKKGQIIEIRFVHWSPLTRNIIIAMVSPHFSRDFVHLTIAGFSLIKLYKKICMTIWYCLKFQLSEIAQIIFFFKGITIEKLVLWICQKIFLFLHHKFLNWKPICSFFYHQSNLRNVPCFRSLLKASVLLL